MRPCDQDIWILLTRVLSDEANSAEKVKFNQWLEEDTANRAFFEELEARWQETPDSNVAGNRHFFDHESGVSRLRHKIRNEKERGDSLVAPLPSASSKRFTGWKVAASILLLVGMIAAWAGMRLWSPPVTHYETSNVEQRIITLPDGSTVRMNKNTSISFRKGLSGPTRTVTLRGEAFFQVKHMSDKPFIIHAGNAVIRDIGTAFNVKQGNGGKIVVAMKEGRATLRSQNASPEEASMLTKNHVGILNNGNVSTIAQNYIQNYMSWMQDRLVFKKMRFDEVVRQLDHIYGIHSSLADSSLATLQLTAYTTSTSLGEVLDMIALSLEIEYRREGEQVIWMKESSQTKIQQNNLIDPITTKD